ncbi:MAG TPA: hypothetical protein VJ140_00910, partial [Actinomycetota bacterium]|nr:hypothetical protein [Actinomycetota bacterium]
MLLFAFGLTTAVLAAVVASANLAPHQPTPPQQQAPGGALPTLPAKPAPTHASTTTTAPGEPTTSPAPPITTPESAPLAAGRPPTTARPATAGAPATVGGRTTTSQALSTFGATITQPTMTAPTMTTSTTT